MGPRTTHWADEVRSGGFSSAWVYLPYGVHSRLWIIIVLVDGLSPFMSIPTTYSIWIFLRDVQEGIGNSLVCQRRGKGTRRSSLPRATWLS